MSLRDTWSRARHRFSWRLLLAVLTGCAIVGVPAVGILAGHFGTWVNFAAHASDHLDQLSRSGVTGIALVTLVMIVVACTGLLPASLIGVTGGSIYGLWDGFVVSAFATLAGALISFAVSRSWLRGPFTRLFMRRAGVQRFGEEVAKRGWRFVCLLRMSPIMPFSVTSYALGLSSISASDYTLGTLASLPALFGYVCIGWLAHAGIAMKEGGADRLRWVIYALGVAATVFLTWYVGRIVASALNRGRNA